MNLSIFYRKAKNRRYPIISFEWVVMEKYYTQGMDSSSICTSVQKRK